MKTFAYFLWVGSVLAMTAPALAENGAVNIAIGSIGSPVDAENGAVNIAIGSIEGPVDAAALQTVRQVIGDAVARGTVDTFMAVSRGEIEEGFSACAEAGFHTEPQAFTAFVRQLRAIHPQPGTFFTVQPTAYCLRDVEVFCTLDVHECPDGSFVGRVPPSCEFAPCPAE